MEVMAKNFWVRSFTVNFLERRVCSFTLGVSPVPSCYCSLERKTFELKLKTWSSVVSTSQNSNYNNRTRGFQPNRVINTWVAHWWLSRHPSQTDAALWVLTLDTGPKCLASWQGTLGLLCFLFLSCLLRPAFPGSSLMAGESLLWVLSGPRISFQIPQHRKIKLIKILLFESPWVCLKVRRVLVSFYFIKSTAVSGHKSKLKFLSWQVLSTIVHTLCLGVGVTFSENSHFPSPCLGLIVSYKAQSQRCQT